MQKPTIGRIVITNARGGESPALITRVHTDQMVNLRVLPDGSSETPMALSVALHEDEATARAVMERQGLPGLHAWWPARG